MRKILIVFFIIFLIFFTALVKNSTKDIEDNIFNVQENVRDLKKELGDTKLEFNYLSSAEKLLEFQTLYFEKDLVQKNINIIKILKRTPKGLEIRDFGISDKNVKK